MASEILDEGLCRRPARRRPDVGGCRRHRDDVAALALAWPAYDADAIHLSRLSLPDLHRLTAELLAMPHEARAALGPMHPGRVDVIGGGAIIVDELARRFAQVGITELVASEHDILDGIARSIA